jgi:hypothetical protein
MGLWGFFENTDTKKEDAKKAYVNNWLENVELSDQLDPFDISEPSDSESESTAPLPSPSEPPVMRKYDIGNVSFSTWRNPYESSLQSQPLYNPHRPAYLNPTHDGLSVSYRRVLQPVPHPAFSQPGVEQENESEEESEDEEGEQRVLA